MKRFMKLVVVLFCLTFLTVGCSKANQKETEAATDAAKDNGTTTEVLSRGTYNPSDYCELTDYKGIQISKKDIVVTDDEVKQEADSLVNSAKELKEVDGKAKTDSVVNIDYTGYIDNKTFEGGSATNTDLTLGSKTFIDGFEDGLIGCKKGDTKKLNLKFPEKYDRNKDLAGKDVVFEVKVNAVKEYSIPKYTDAFVKEHTDYSTIKEYEKSVKESLRKEKIQKQLAAKLLANAKFSTEYPESLKSYYQKNYEQYYDNMMQTYYGYTLEDYLKNQNSNLETFLEEELGEQIENAMQGDLLLGVIAQKEGIRAEGSAYDQYLENAAKERKVSKEELIQQYGEEELQFAYTSDKAYDVVYDSIVIK